MPEKRRKQHAEEAQPCPHKISYDDFMVMGMPEVEDLVNSSGLIVVGVRPWDLFASQKWTTDEKIVLAEEDASTRGESDRLLVHAYTYEHPTQDDRKPERRIVLIDQHHRATRGWIPDMNHPKGKGVRFDVAITEVRSQSSAERESGLPMRLSRFRRLNQADFWAR